MKIKKKYHAVGTVSKSNRKLVATEAKIVTSTTHNDIHDRSLSMLGASTSITNVGVKVVVRSQNSHPSEIMCSWKRFPHVSEMPMLTCNWVSIVVIKNALILIIIHNIANLRNRSDDVMVGLLTLNAEDRGSKPLSDQFKNYKIGICCFSASCSKAYWQLNCDSTLTIVFLLCLTWWPRVLSDIWIMMTTISSL